MFSHYLGTHWKQLQQFRTPINTQLLTLSEVYEVFYLKNITNLLLGRCEDSFESFPPTNAYIPATCKSGFKPNKSTVDQIVTLRLLIELKITESKLKLYKDQVVSVLLSCNLDSKELQNFTKYCSKWHNNYKSKLKLQETEKNQKT